MFCDSPLCFCNMCLLDHSKFGSSVVLPHFLQAILSLSLPISLCTISFQGLLTIILDTLWQKLKIYLVCFLWFTPRVSLFFRYFESTVKNYIYSNSTFLTQHKSKCKLDVIFASLFLSYLHLWCFVHSTRQDFAWKFGRQSCDRHLEFGIFAPFHPFIF